MKNGYTYNVYKIKIGEPSFANGMIKYDSSYELVDFDELNNLLKSEILDKGGAWYGEYINQFVPNDDHFYVMIKHPHIDKMLNSEEYEGVVGNILKEIVDRIKSENKIY